MAQTYTIEEAATRLGIAQEELKRRLREDWKSIRSFRDGPTLRFRASDIDDLARTLGQSSDPGVQPGNKAASGSDEFLTPPGDGSSEELVFKTDKKAKKPGDSDIRLDVATGPKSDPNEHQLTEEISLDVAGPGSSKLSAPSSSKLSAPKSGKISGPSDIMTNTDSSSEFELSLDSDSDSFELDLNTGSGEKAPLAGKGGIKLDKPADKGVNLGDSDESMEFELSLDSPGTAPKKPAAAKNVTTESDSEFELALDDNSGITEGLAESIQKDEKGDIFETDFDLPAIDDSESGSEVVAVEDSDAQNSDFDIALDESDVQIDEDESASQVVLIDDEDEVPQVKSGKGKMAALAGGAAAAAGAVAFSGTDDTPSASKALRGVRDDDDDAPVRVVQASTPKWGLLPVLMSGLAVVPIFLGMLMGLESVKSMTGYKSAPLVKGVASMLGMAPNEGK